jgi:3(or 17)beta-hydroxysteroid dehydrogenase
MAKETTMNRVQGKVAVITGGAAGVGRASALQLAAEGARVVITDVDEERGHALAREIGAQATFVRHDIGNEADWQHVMAQAQQIGPVGVLVNNAGIYATGTIEDTSLEQWRKLQRVNGEGTFLGCKYGVAAMRAAPSGSIINLSSAAALGGMSTLAAYSATKGAITALTRSVAAHCKQQGYRIRCNSIHPGGIATDMTRALRADLGAAAVGIDADPRAGFCEPSDVAYMVAYLASDESRFVNGAELRIDNALLTTCM